MKEVQGKDRKLRGQVGIGRMIFGAPRLWMFVVRSGCSECQTKRCKPNDQRGDSLAHFSPTLFLSVAFRSLLRLIFHQALTAGGPHLMLIEQP